MNSIARWRPCSELDHLAGRGVQGSKQARGAVALVVVRGAGGRAGQHQQDRLAAVERLDLALLVHAQHDGALGRVQIQPDDVPDLLDEQRVLGELPVLHAVGLQAERPPHPRDRRLRHAGLARHLARGPVRAAVRRHRLQRLDDHLLDLLVAHRPRPARPRLVDQPVQPALGEPRPPLRHRRTAHPDPQRDLRVALTLRAPSTIRARCASPDAVRRLRAHRSNCPRSPSLNRISTALGPRVAMPKTTRNNQETKD